MAANREIILGANYLERIGIEQVFEQLKCSNEGLTSNNGAYRLKIFGPNKLEELKKAEDEERREAAIFRAIILVVVMLTISCFIPIEGEGKLLDWPFMVALGVLILLNCCIYRTIQFDILGKAADAVGAVLAPKTKVLRDGRWSKQDAAILVPGDIISIKPGDIIPADARLLLNGDPLTIDYSTLTGQSLPITKNPGDVVLSGSTCKQGEHNAVVIATGMRTFFGNTAHLVNRAANLVDNYRVGYFKPANAIKCFNIFTMFVGVIVELIVMSLFQKERPLKGRFGNPLLLMVGLFPTAMRNVLLVTMATGAHRLAQHGAVIKGKAAIEKLAGMDVLCSDITGTLIIDKNLISRALVLGVNVKMIIGDQLDIAKEIGQRLGMGTNMYPSSSLLSQDEEASSTVDDLIEKADGFAEVFPEHKSEIVQRLQRRKHICGMTGYGVNDAPALKKADIGITMADATDAARDASDVVLTEPGLSVIISAVLTSRAILQRMNSYMIYNVSIITRVALGFTLVALIWKFDFPPFMVLVIAILNDSTTMSAITTISEDRVKPSPMPVSWKLKEIFAIGIVLGSYLAFMMVIFFWAMKDTDFFTDKFGVRSLRHSDEEMISALFLQVCIMSQSVIFVSRSCSWSFIERRELCWVGAFMVAQLIATLVAVYAHSNLVRIKGIGWGWAGVIWLYSIVSFFCLYLLKFAILYIQSGKEPPRDELAFTTGKDYNRCESEVTRIVVY